VVAVAGAAAVATAVGAATLLWPSATPSALAGWDPAPTVMAADDAAAVDAACRTAYGTESAGAELLHVDQRGATAVATYRGAGWDHSCLILGNGDGWDGGDPSDLVFYSVATGPAAPGADDPFPGPVVAVRPAWASHVELGGVVVLEGEVEPSVAEVVVVATDGERLDAKLTDGHFTVFWPTGEWPARDGSAPVPDDVVVEALDAGGQVAGTATVSFADLVEATEAAADAADAADAQAEADAVAGEGGVVEGVEVVVGAEATG
jgi:hypothetical protein